jgi:hypothetical protein
MLFDPFLKERLKSTTETFRILNTACFFACGCPQDGFKHEKVLPVGCSQNEVIIVLFFKLLLKKQGKNRISDVREPVPKFFGAG